MDNEVTYTLEMLAIDEWINRGDYGAQGRELAIAHMRTEASLTGARHRVVKHEEIAST